jgi:hypothetical protein
LVPVRKQLGLKAGAFNPALLVSVATTGTNGLYKPGLKAFFPPVQVGPMASVGSMLTNIAENFDPDDTCGPTFTSIGACGTLWHLWVQYD